MKIKYIALTLAAILSFGTFAVGCSSSENSEQQILDSREVDFSEIGLKYKWIHTVFPLLSIASFLDGNRLFRPCPF